jgi:DNA-binding MarR family transcriptional regulator
MTDPTPTTTAIWTRLIRAGSALTASIEAALKAQGLPPLGWYDVLWEIDQAASGIRPLALQERLLLPQYGLSRLVERLDKAGYVTRQACEADGRGQVLVLTEAGRAVRARMWPVYSAALVTGLQDRFSREEALTLARLLERLSAPEQA